MIAKVAVALLVASFATSCSALLDFDDENGLSCPCLPDYVCLRSTNRCVRQHSVDDYKACSPDAEFPDSLCQPNSRCYNYNERGPRCLPKCTPTQYTTPEAGTYVANQCRPATTCWAIHEGGGVCDEGECNDFPNDCPAPKRCVRFNGAGVCFTPCQIFDSTPCIGGAVCHPIGNANTTACVTQGSKNQGEDCSDPATSCQKADLGSGKPMVCDRPNGSADVPRCRTICPYPDGTGCGPGQNCQFARPQIDDVGRNLGLCMPGG